RGVRGAGAGGPERVGPDAGHAAHRLAAGGEERAMNISTRERDEAEAVLQQLAAVAGSEQPATTDRAAPLPPRPGAPPASSAQSFRDLVEALPDAVVVTDRAGTIVLVNRQTEVLFGYGRDELLGQMIEILIPGRFRDQHVSLRHGYFAQPTVRPMGARKP